MSGQPPALHFMCLRKSQAKDKHRRTSKRAKLDKQIRLSYLHLEAGVRDGWVLSFPEKCHVCEGPGPGRAQCWCFHCHAPVSELLDMVG